MAVYTNNSAGAASGTSVTAANSDDNAAGDAFSVTSGTRIYDNTWSHSGTTSFKCSGAGAAGLLGWNVGTTGNASFKGWFWFSSLPAATQSILQCRIASPDSNGGDVMVQSNGRLRFGTSGWVSNTVLSTSTAYRLEACYTAGASSTTGRVRIAIFLGDDLIPLETYSIDETNTGTTTFSGFRFGKVTSSGTWDVWFDDVTYNDGGTSFISSGITLKEGAVRDARSKVAGTASTSETITLPDFVSGDSIIMVVARDTTSANTFSGDSDCSVTEIVTGNRKISALLLTPANGSITSFVLSNSTSAKWRWWVGSIVGIDPSYAIEAAHSDIGSNTTNAMAIPTITTSHGDTVPNGVSIAGASVTTTATWNPIASTFFYSASGNTAMSVGFKPVTEGSGTVTWSDFDRGSNGSSRDESVLSLYLRPFDAEATAVAVTSISSSGILKAIANPDDVVSTSSIACSADVIDYAEAQADAVTSASASANYIPIASATVASVSSVSVDSYVIDYGVAQADAVTSVTASALTIDYAVAQSDAVTSVAVSALTIDYASTQADAVSSISVAAKATHYASTQADAVSTASASALTVDYASTQADAVTSITASALTVDIATATVASVSSVSVDSYVISSTSVAISASSSISASAVSLVEASALVGSSTLVRVSDGYLWDGDLFYDDDIFYDPSPSSVPYVIAVAVAVSSAVSSVSAAASSTLYGLVTLAATSSVSVSANSVLLAAADTSSAVSAVSVDAVVRSSASASAAAVSSVSVSSVVISYSSVTVSAVSSVSASALSVTYASTISAAVSDVSISSATQYAYGIAASNVVSAVSGAATVLMYGTALSSVVSSVSISGYTADYGIASVDIVSVASAAAVLRSYGQASVVSTSELSLSGLAVLFSSVSISSSFSVSVSATAVYVGSAVCITSSLVEVVFAEAVITPAYVSPIISISSIVVVGGLLFEASVSTSALASTVEVHIYKDMPALRNLSAENMSSFYDATSLSVVGEGALTADLLPFSDAALLVDTDFGDLTEVVSAEASLSL